MNRSQLRPNMTSELVLFQVAAIVALVGMSLGWRGVMTRYSGFYDLPTAWSMMFWGIIIGGFYGLLCDYFLLRPYLELGVPSITNLTITFLLAVVVHMMLRRERVRKTGSQPTTGWTLGLSVGGMIGMYTIYRMLEIFSDEVWLLAMNVALVAIISPRAHALLFCRHGYHMLNGMRWKAVLRTFIWGALLITSIYTAAITPLYWIFIIPFVLIAEKSAHDWVWAAVPKPARRRLRRIWADAARQAVKEEE